MPLPDRTRCDLHLHSSASATNHEWYSRLFGCPESYAEPAVQYERCKARGMVLVTLTDHDTIAGGLQLVDRPDFFLSEEISTVFPEDGCALHVLAWNITQAQHELLQQARASVYELVDVLRREQIAHACAHPLFSPNWKLTADALERIVVLFPVLEGVNGLVDRRLQGDLERVLGGLDDQALAALARRHGLPPRVFARPVLTAGSDDHVTRQCASCFVEVAGRVGPRELLDAVVAGEASCIGQSADLAVMQLAASRVAYEFLDARRAEQPAYRDPFHDLVDTVAGKPARGGDGLAGQLVDSFLRGAARTATPLGCDLDPADCARADDATNARIVGSIARVHDGVLGNAVDELLAAAGDLDLYRALGALRDLGGAVATALPFLLAADHFAKQREQADRVLAHWRATPVATTRPRLAIFSDTLGHVDGVNTSVRRFAREARAHGHEVRVPYFGPRPQAGEDELAFVAVPAATSLEVGLYSGLELYVPSLLGTVDWLWRDEITHVELATPGPVGLVGMLAARLARLPVIATYHTELTLMLRQLSGNPLVHACARRLSSWFYGAADRVLVFSNASRRRLIELGVSDARIRNVAVTIDPQEYSPSHASRSVYRALGISAPVERVALAVGRLSPEKNFRVIVDAIARLQHTVQPPTLVIAGDGPQRAALAAYCADKPFVALVGNQPPDVLKQLYASADTFVFASQIDALGLVALEAMASGVPVLVPEGTAIAEVVVDGITGCVYPFGVAGLADALARVLACAETRATLAANARRAMVERWSRTSFRERWDTLVAG
ncbi:MAG: glycosyltransferase [Acidobacteriota bacterium]